MPTFTAESVSLKYYPVSCKIALAKSNYQILAFGKRGKLNEMF